MRTPLLALSLAVAAAVLTAPAASAASASIAWKKCESPILREAGAQCGYLSVPLDHAKPKGKKIRLAVSRIRHTAGPADYQGVLLINPGGPGGSGRGEVLQSSGMPKKVAAAYDWIGFDPRGVGASRPALTCDGDYFSYDRPKYVPSKAKGEKLWLRRTENYAEKCARAGGALLDHLKSTDNVKDLELLRKALGQKQINFIGYSYGSYLGQVYATQYPQRVRRMVLDGVVDPRKVWYQANLEQDEAFDANLRAFFGWVAEHHSTYRLGKTRAAVQKQYYRQLHALDRKAAGGKIGGNEWTDLFQSAGYSSSSWMGTAEAFSGWVHRGRWKPLKELYDEAGPQGPGADNGYAVYLATICTDTTWPARWSQWRRGTRAMHARAPYLAWSNTWYNAPCRFWAGKAGRAPKVDGSKAPPILLLSETHDAATPISGALEVRRRFPKSVLVEGVGGYDHSASPLGSACTTGTIGRYLLTGQLPPRVEGRSSDKRCAPAFQP